MLAGFMQSKTLFRADSLISSPGHIINDGPDCARGSRFSPPQHAGPLCAGFNKLVRAAEEILTKCPSAAPCWRHLNGSILTWEEKFRPRKKLIILD